MKQAQSEVAQYALSSRARPRTVAVPYGWHPTRWLISTEGQVLERASSWAEICLFLFSKLLYLFALPFRLIFWSIAWVGRLAAILFGFCLMVVGIALWAGPLFFLGIPLFLIGLLLMLKSLG